MGIPATTHTDELRAMIERWAQAVRDKDMAGILRDHADDFLMFDVPPPLECRGIDAYRETWQPFFDASPVNPVFDIVDLAITAGDDVAFATASMRCVMGRDDNAEDLDFRLTIGFGRVDGRWTFLHEHHSVPATN